MSKEKVPKAPRKAEKMLRAARTGREQSRLRKPKK